MMNPDNPSIFPDNVIVAVSTRSDQTMLDRTKGQRHDADIVMRRRTFTAAYGIDYDDVVYQVISYGDERDYDTIKEVNISDTTKNGIDIHADALFTRQAGVGLFLPVADCVSTVVYDPLKQFLALAHVGRHASIADLPAKLIDHFTREGSNSSDLLIWMAPHVQKNSYRMDYFDQSDDARWKGFVHHDDDGIYVDMSGYARKRYCDKGVGRQNIFISHVDTAQSERYFSHSRGDGNGRFAVVAMMKAI